MNVQIAQVTLEFLSRVELKGAEVPAFNAITSVFQEVLEKAQQEAQEAQAAQEAE